MNCKNLKDVIITVLGTLALKKQYSKEINYNKKK